MRALCTLVLVSAAMAQPGLGPRPQGVQSSNGAASASGDPNSAGRRASGPANLMPGMSGRFLFVSGRVMISGGSGAPPDQVAILRVCGGSATREAFTDSTGRFAFQLSGSRSQPDVSLGTSQKGGSADGGGGESLRGCEIRAELSGYRSDSVTLMDAHSIENPEIGTIFLHRMAGGEGFTITATTALAPKEARKTYEKGLDEIRHNLPDQAQRSFLQAVELFPRFAAAWLELGSVYERRDHFSQAREAYKKAIEADSGYLDSYQRLYRLALKESMWQEAANASDKVLRLNPYDFPSAYYVNAVANFRLHDLDQAEKRARQSVQLQGPQKEPAAHYVLGSILAEKGDFAGSAEALQTFLNSAVSSADRSGAEKLLRDVEWRAQARSPEPSKFPEP